MNLRMVAFCLGMMVAALGLFMMIPALVDLAQGESLNAQSFAVCGIGSFFVGSLLSLSNSHYRKNMGVRDGFILTTAGWVIGSFLASLPLHFSNLHLSYADSFFEAVSGFTTTGSTILGDVESASPGILVWRSLLQWIGGMGVIGLAIVLLPLMNIGGMQLFQTESSDRSEKALPRASKIVRAIFIVYSALTALCALSYYALGMPGFDAINHAMTTVPTGGYSTRNTSFTNYSAALQWTAIIFMTLGGLPFILYIKLLWRRNMALFTDSQVRGTLALIGASAILMTLWLYFQKPEMPVMDSLRLTTFNIVSVLSTTGYAATNYMLWGTFPATLFLFLTYIGMCSGSTAGGLKIMRLEIVTQHCIVQFKKLFYPHGVFTVSYEGRPVSWQIVQSVMVFLFIYVVANALTTLLLCTMGLDFMTALSGAATALSNAGAGIGPVIGPAGNFSPLPAGAKYVLSIAMLLGRLELMTVLVLLHPSFWRR